MSMSWLEDSHIHLELQEEHIQCLWWEGAWGIPWGEWKPVWLEQTVRGEVQCMIEWTIGLEWEYATPCRPFWGLISKNGVFQFSI